MTRPEADAILDRCHNRKRRMNPTRARESAVEKRSHGVPVSPYLCPFSSHTGGDHWHVGHPPSETMVERIAAAIRFYNEHGIAADPEHDPVAAYAPARGDPPPAT